MIFFFCYRYEFVWYVFSEDWFHAEVCLLIRYRYEFVGYRLSVNCFMRATVKSLYSLLSLVSFGAGQQQLVSNYCAEPTHDHCTAGCVMSSSSAAAAAPHSMLQLTMPKSNNQITTH